MMSMELRPNASQARQMETVNLSMSRQDHWVMAADVRLVVRSDPRQCTRRVRCYDKEKLACPERVGGFLSEVQNYQHPPWNFDSQLHLQAATSFIQTKLAT